jgi:hypothetical protein
MSDADLAEALKIWFEKHAGNPHLWQTQVGAVLRGRLVARGNFKNAPRGNPKRAWKAMLAKKGVSSIGGRFSPPRGFAPDEPISNATRLKQEMLGHGGA